MFSYEGGLVLSLFLWLLNSAEMIVHINSQLERNLNKIGQRISWATLTPKAMSAEDEARSTLAKIGKYLLIVGFNFPFVFLSWLFVAYFVGFWFYRRSKDSGVPQVVKEFRWKLKNYDLSFDEVVKESMKVVGEPPEKFDTFRESFVLELREKGLFRG